MDIPDLDFISLAKGYGATGVKAETLEGVMRECQAALNREGPTVLAVPIKPTIPPLL